MTVCKSKITKITTYLPVEGWKNVKELLNVLG